MAVTDTTLPFDQALAAKHAGIARAFLIYSRARGRALTAQEFGSPDFGQVIDEASGPHVLGFLANRQGDQVAGPHREVPLQELVDRCDGPGSIEDWQGLREDVRPNELGTWTIEDRPWHIVFRTLVSSDGVGTRDAEGDVPIGQNRTRYRYFEAPELTAGRPTGQVIIAAVATPNELVMVIPNRTPAGEETVSHITLQAGDLEAVAPFFQTLMEGITGALDCRLGRTTLLARPAEIDESGAEAQLAQGTLGLGMDPRNRREARLRALDLIENGHVSRLLIDLQENTIFSVTDPEEAAVLDYLRRLVNQPVGIVKTAAAFNLLQESTLLSRLPSQTLEAPAEGVTEGAQTVGAQLRPLRVRAHRSFLKMVDRDNHDEGSPSLADLADQVARAGNELVAFDVISTTPGFRFDPLVHRERVAEANKALDLNPLRGTLVLADVRNFLALHAEGTQFPRIGISLALHTRTRGFLWADMSDF